NGLTPVGSSVYFVGDQGQLWRSNGQPGGATQVDTGGKPVDFSAETNTFRPNMVAAGPWLYFFTDDGDGNYTLSRNDSRTGETEPSLQTFGSVTLNVPFAMTAAPAGLTPFGQEVYYLAYDSIHGYELHRTAGVTKAHTVFDLLPGPDSSVPSKPWATSSYVY